MIGKLIGVLDSVFDGFIILNVSGVGYRVFVSGRTINALPAVNNTVALFIETQVREDHIHLFGFLSMAEQNLFNTLTTVQGVGAKVGLGILTYLSLDDIQMAIMTGDSKAFTAVPGIGPKLGVRIITELKSKMGSLNLGSVLPDSIDASAFNGKNKDMDEAISALVNLGYSKLDAGMVVATILKENDSCSLSDLIRLSLKEIGKANG